jgi:DNA-binding transcriptional MerR regulator
MIMEKRDYTEQELEYSLSVGEFAKLCETTRDTLRHYYEQEILVPRVDPENGYHYYSASQIGSFFFINTMRQAGCSIKEIKEAIYNSTRQSLTKMVNSKILEMQRQLYLINKKISALHLGMWILGKYDTEKAGIPFLSEIPEISISKTPTTNKVTAYHTADIASDISVHLKKTSVDNSLSAFPSGVTIAYEDLLKRNFVYNNIVSLSLLPADNVHSFMLPSITAVCCYHNNQTDSIDNSYDKITGFIKKNKLKPLSDLYSISLINLYSGEAAHTYFKFLFICVGK